MKKRTERTPAELADLHEMLAQMCSDNDDKPGAKQHMEVAHAIRRLLIVSSWAQAVLTALNTGDIQQESPIHKKLREVMIASRSNTQIGNAADKETQP